MLVLSVTSKWYSQVLQLSVTSKIYGQVLQLIVTAMLYIQVVQPSVTYKWNIYELQPSVTSNSYSYFSEFSQILQPSFWELSWTDGVTVEFPPLRVSVQFPGSGSGPAPDNCELNSMFLIQPWTKKLLLKEHCKIFLHRYTKICIMFYLINKPEIW